MRSVSVNITRRLRSLFDAERRKRFQAEPRAAEWYTVVFFFLSSTVHRREIDVPRDGFAVQLRAIDQEKFLSVSPAGRLRKTSWLLIDGKATFASLVARTVYIRSERFRCMIILLLTSVVSR